MTRGKGAEEARGNGERKRGVKGRKVRGKRKGRIGGVSTGVGGREEGIGVKGRGEIGERGRERHKRVKDKRIERLGKGEKAEGREKERGGKGR